MSEIIFHLHELKNSDEKSKKNFSHLTMMTNGFSLKCLDIDLSLIPHKFIKEYLIPENSVKKETRTHNIYRVEIGCNLSRFLFILKVVLDITKNLHYENFPSVDKMYTKIFFGKEHFCVDVSQKNDEELSRDQILLLNSLLVLGEVFGNKNAQNCLIVKHED